MLTTGVVVCSSAGNVRQWILITLCCFLGAAVTLFLMTYLKLVDKDPDTLRSEKFLLRKLEIEHTLIGDNVVGLKEIPNGSLDTPRLTTNTSADSLDMPRLTSDSEEEE